MDSKRDPESRESARIQAPPVDDYRRLADLGATDTVAGFVSEGSAMLDDIRRFGEEIIAKV